jgi:EpsI family protein
MSRTVVLTVATVLILSGTLTASLVVGNRNPSSLARPLDQIPMKLGPWTGAAQPEPQGRVLYLLQSTSTLSRTYSRNGRTLDLFIAYYAVQRAGESMHTPKNCLPGAGWEISKYDSADIPLDGRVEKINKFTIQNSGARAMVLYWYQTRNRIIANEYKGKGLMLWDSITKGRSDGSVVKITLADQPGAAEDAVKFAGLVMSQMRTAFGR